MHPFWTLIPLSVLLGCILAWAFGRMSNQDAIRDARRRISARLYEVRLFADEPGLVMRAQAGLFRDTLRYFRFTAVPIALLAIPMVVLLAQLDGFYGASPLQPGRPAGVTVQLKQAMRETDGVPRLEAPEGFRVETPAVRVLQKGQVSWRIRPVEAASGDLYVTVNEARLAKSISSEAAPRRLSPRRVSSWAQLLWQPVERPIRSDAVEWIEVAYPPSEIEAFGLRLHWLAWFSIFSILAALVFARRIGVAY